MADADSLIFTERHFTDHSNINYDELVTEINSEEFNDLVYIEFEKCEITNLEVFNRVLMILIQRPLAFKEVQFHGCTLCDGFFSSHKVSPLQPGGSIFPMWMATLESVVFVDTLTDDLVLEFADMLRIHGSHLKTIMLKSSNVLLQRKNCGKLLRTIANPHSQLEQLFFTDVDISRYGTVIGEFCSNPSTKLKSLTLNKCAIDDTFIRNFLARKSNHGKWTFRNIPSLKILELRQNMITDKSANDLLQSVQGNHINLETVSLQENTHVTEQGKECVQVIRLYHLMTDKGVIKPNLDLENILDDRIIKHVTHLLFKGGNRVKYLRISSTLLGHNSLDMIIETVYTYCKNIEELTFIDTDLSSFGNYFYAMFHEFERLTHATLTNCAIDDEFINNMTGANKSNPEKFGTGRTLGSLSLQYNNISDDGLRTLLAAIRHESAITQLFLNNNPRLTEQSFTYINDMQEIMVSVYHDIQ